MYSSHLLKVTAEQIQQAFEAALLPLDVLQVAHLSPESVNTFIKHPGIDFTSFTGSVQNGRNVAKASVENPWFPGVALEVCSFTVTAASIHDPPALAWRKRPSLRAGRR